MHVVTPCCEDDCDGDFEEELGLFEIFAETVEGSVTEGSGRTEVVNVVEGTAAADTRWNVDFGCNIEENPAGVFVICGY